MAICMEEEEAGWLRGRGIAVLVGDQSEPSDRQRHRHGRWVGLTRGG